MPMAFIPSNQSTTAIAHHEAGHLVLAWIYRVPFSSATIAPNRTNILGLVSGGGQLAPCPIDVHITNTEERARLVRALTGESYILMAGIVSELHYAGTLVDELLLPDTNDPTEDTALVRDYIQTMRWIAERQNANRNEQERMQHSFQLNVAKIVRNPLVWRIISDVARLLLERQTIRLDDYYPLLQPHEEDSTFIALRSELGVDPSSAR
jgi:hypothetical protein